MISSWRLSRFQVPYTFQPPLGASTSKVLTPHQLCPGCNCPPFNEQSKRVHWDGFLGSSSHSESVKCVPRQVLAKTATIKISTDGQRYPHYARAPSLPFPPKSIGRACNCGFEHFDCCQLILYHGYCRNMGLSAIGRRCTLCIYFN